MPPWSASSAMLTALSPRTLVRRAPCRPRRSADVSLRPALIAVQFLTRLPIRLEPPPAGREVGLSLLWYPALGLLLGLLLWVVRVLLRPLAAPLAAAIVLALWVACSPALHLAGLADTADAWVGGRGDRERTLAIMKDPYSGPVAVVAVVCLLLVKFCALSALRAGRCALERPALCLRLRSATAAGARRRRGPVRTHSLCACAGHRGRSFGVSITGRSPLGRPPRGTRCHRRLRPLWLIGDCRCCGGLSRHAASVCSTSGRHDG